MPFNPAVFNTGVRAAARRSDIVDIFKAGDQGDVWVFTPETTDGAVDGDAITEVIGSANGNTLTTISGSPEIKEVDGQWVLRTDGVSFSDRLRCQFGATLSQPGTVVAVFSSFDLTSHIVVTGADASNRWQISQDSGGDLIMFAGSEVDTYKDEPYGKVCVIAEFNGASSEARVDGVVTETGDAGSQSITEINVAALWDGSLNGAMDLYGLIVIDRALTDAEKDQVDEWAFGLLGIGTLPSGAPSSITKLVLPSSFAFSGGSLASVTPVYGSPAHIWAINGTPDEGANGGYEMDEASTNDWVGLDLPSAEAQGVHLAILYKRNGTADDATIMFGSSSISNYAFCAQNGGTSLILTNGMTADEYRANGTTVVDGVGDRNALWDAMFPDTDPHAAAVKNLKTNFIGRLGSYPGSTSFIFEGEILGWAEFTDWDQVDDVLSYLEAQA